MDCEDAVPPPQVADEEQACDWHVQPELQQLAATPDQSQKIPIAGGVKHGNWVRELNAARKDVEDHDERAAKAKQVGEEIQKSKEKALHLARRQGHDP